ncbi:DNA-binding protein [Nitrosomonas halophila]|uniref:Replication region DNA-binding N-term n=1 Tax=Nitrosomonas halophila TaxID=44576 RepID=A0A1H3MZZ5_9PROT|nr:DNA-binding protein [Nitrosomonas halophila]SDY81785.1 replication region DNA-binding N-term [Nitrosomonas halophila]
MELTKETRERIFTAADALFEQNGRDTFPTVDAVRKAAHVNMNDASSGMKEWRRAQTAQAVPVAVQVPQAVQAAGSHAVAVLWQQAQELANELLRAAQSKWEGERAELDIMRTELADAYEAQVIELDTAQGYIEDLKKALATTGELAQAHDKALAELRESLVASERRAALAEQKAEEIERRARELRAELDRAHQEADRLRQERDQAVGRAKATEEERDTARDEALDALAEIDKIKTTAGAEREAHQEQRKIVAQEAARQAERYTKVQAERDSIRKEAAQAREDAATLRGRLEVLETVLAKAEKDKRERGKNEKP